MQYFLLAASKLTTSDKVAVGAVLFAALQFVALVATIVVMVRTGRRQLRAYVFIDTGDIINVAKPMEDVPDGKEPPKGALRWNNLGPVAVLRTRNTGQTPAYEMIHWAAIELREYPLTSAPPKKLPRDRNTTVITLGANVVSTKNVSMPRPLSDDDVASLRAATKAIWVFGEIVYRDAFGKRRFTRYRYRHNGLTGNVGVSAELTGADEGNAAN